MFMYPRRAGRHVTGQTYDSVNVILRPHPPRSARYPWYTKPDVAFKFSFLSDQTVVHRDLFVTTYS